MKHLPLTQGKVAIVDDEDYHYLARFSWTYAEVDGLAIVRRGFLHKRGVRQIRIEDYIVARPQGGAHSFVFKNGDRLDFRKSNLAFVALPGVKQRARKQKDTTSRYKGVSRNTGRGKAWRVQIESGTRGSDTYERRAAFFDTEAEAARKYNEWARDLFGPDAWQNVIEDNEDRSPPLPDHSPTA